MSSNDFQGYNYTNLDYDTLYDTIVDFFKNDESSPFRTENGFDFEGSNIRELMRILTYVTHLSVFHCSIALNEMYFSTARLRKNLIKQVKAYGYVPKRKRSSRKYLTIYNNSDTIVSIPSFEEFKAETSTKGTKKFYTLDSYDIPPKSSTTILTYQSNNGPQVQNFTLEFDKGKVVPIEIELDNLSDDYFKVETKEGGVIIPWTEYQNLDSLQNQQTVLEQSLLSENKIFFLDESEKGYTLSFSETGIGDIPAPDDEQIITVRYMTTDGTESNGISTDEFDFSDPSKYFDVNGQSKLRILSNTEITDAASIDSMKLSSQGANKESISEIRENVIAQYNSQNRAITDYDYTKLAKTSPLIGATGDVKAYGGEKHSGGIRLGKVFVLGKPGIEGKYYLTASEKEEFLNYISKYKITGIDPVIQHPHYINVIAKYNYIFKHFVNGQEEISAELNNLILDFFKSSFGKVIYIPELIELLNKNENIESAFIKTDFKIIFDKLEQVIGTFKKIPMEYGKASGFLNSDGSFWTGNVFGEAGDYTSEPSGGYNYGTVEFINTSEDYIIVKIANGTIDNTTFEEFEKGDSYLTTRKSIVDLIYQELPNEREVYVTDTQGFERGRNVSSFDGNNLIQGRTEFVRRTSQGIKYVWLTLDSLVYQKLILSPGDNSITGTNTFLKVGDWIRTPGTTGQITKMDIQSFKIFVEYRGNKFVEDDPIAWIQSSVISWTDAANYIALRNVGKIKTVETESYLIKTSKVSGGAGGDQNFFINKNIEPQNEWQFNDINTSYDYSDFANDIAFINGVNGYTEIDVVYETNTGSPGALEVADIVEFEIDNPISDSNKIKAYVMAVDATTITFRYNHLDSVNYLTPYVLEVDDKFSEDTYDSGNCWKITAISDIRKMNQIRVTDSVYGIQIGDDVCAKNDKTSIPDGKSQYMTAEVIDISGLNIRLDSSAIMTDWRDYDVPSNKGVKQIHKGTYWEDINVTTVTYQSKRYSNIAIEGLRLNNVINLNEGDILKTENGSGKIKTGGISTSNKEVVLTLDNPINVENRIDHQDDFTLCDNDGTNINFEFTKDEGSTSSSGTNEISISSNDSAQVVALAIKDAINLAMNGSNPAFTAAINGSYDYQVDVTRITVGNSNLSNDSNITDNGSGYPDQFDVPNWTDNGASSSATLTITACAADDIMEPGRFITSSAGGSGIVILGGSTDTEITVRYDGTDFASTETVVLGNYYFGTGYSTITATEFLGIEVFLEDIVGTFAKGTKNIHKVSAATDDYSPVYKLSEYENVSDFETNYIIEETGNEENLPLFINKLNFEAAGNLDANPQIDTIANLGYKVVFNTTQNLDSDNISLKVTYEDNSSTETEYTFITDQNENLEQKLILSNHLYRAYDEPGKVQIGDVVAQLKADGTSTQTGIVSKVEIDPDTNIMSVYVRFAKGTFRTQDPNTVSFLKVLPQDGSVYSDAAYDFITKLAVPDASDFAVGSTNNISAKNGATGSVFYIDSSPTGSSTDRDYIYVTYTGTHFTIDTTNNNNRIDNQGSYASASYDTTIEEIYGDTSADGGNEKYWNARAEIRKIEYTSSPTDLNYYIAEYERVNLYLQRGDASSYSVGDTISQGVGSDPDMTGTVIYVKKYDIDSSQEELFDYVTVRYDLNTSSMWTTGSLDTGGTVIHVGIERPEYIARVNLVSGDVEIRRTKFTENTRRAYIASIGSDYIEINTTDGSDPITSFKTPGSIEEPLYIWNNSAYQWEKWEYSTLNTGQNRFENSITTIPSGVTAGMEVFQDTDHYINRIEFDFKNKIDRLKLGNRSLFYSNLDLIKELN